MIGMMQEDWAVMDFHLVSQATMSVAMKEPSYLLSSSSSACGLLDF